jgi:hypothetical protein
LSIDQQPKNVLLTSVVHGISYLFTQIVPIQGTIPYIALKLSNYVNKHKAQAFRFTLNLQIYSIQTETLSKVNEIINIFIFS